MMSLPNASSLPVDPEVLAMLADLQEPGEPDLLGELVALFLRDAPERLGAIDRGLADGDLATVERAAHSLKGSASNLGAMGLHCLAACVEEQARLGNPTATAAEAAPLAGEFERVRTHLELVVRGRTH
jgi:two-component system, sensor histidine kinase and response regulator